MGQTTSSAEAVKHDEVSTDSVSNYDDDDSSLNSSSSGDSSETSDSSISSVESVEEKPNRTNDFKLENETNAETSTTPTSPRKTDNETRTTNPSRLFLREPSTPAQWIDYFRTSTDDELISLLEKDGIVHSDKNCCDLSPLCAQIRSTAAKVGEYRALETALGSKRKSDLSEQDSVCFYDFRSSSSQNIDDNDDLIDLCERILKASSKRHATKSSRSKRYNKKTKAMYTLSRVRQKLVPSKLKEHIFWESLWVILYERKKAKADQTFFQSIERSTRRQEENAPTSSEQPLYQQLQTAQECISEFMVRYQEETKKREQMEALVEKMWETMPKNHEEPKKPQGVSSLTEKSKDLPCVKFGGNKSTKDEDAQDNKIADSKSSQASGYKHTGTWVMSADSVEFLGFPSEAKEALRTEKQKRLQRVKEEMAFILDSDDPKDAHGEWSCCHNTNYNEACR
mmetsp:Transcript_5585/g.11555  ORF Transcript_5585/g.11555 Transcript_5585/m.11555 type:complete len:454 (+) Transcript_5585:73-1434(+)|eukprot:CAMPEP_0197265364 /NCGR_PEP_ID=MMETSP1432-20130617/2355_1 /TAXON_ID=44447 /ORGANISM="Pseudo-nitzschia delicatissima, Strain UNC1205" /LENGTH=453 /DNA_ID=CAMNT_0042730099 /DNA_START=37 /DNA_END=1398 /DNA_ORIENTATION=-